MTECTPIFSIAEVPPIHSFPASQRGFFCRSARRIINSLNVESSKLMMTTHQCDEDTMLRTTKKPGYKP